MNIEDYYPNFVCGQHYAEVQIVNNFLTRLHNVRSASSRLWTECVTSLKGLEREQTLYEINKKLMQEIDGVISEYQMAGEKGKS